MDTLRWLRDLFRWAFDWIRYAFARGGELWFYTFGAEWRECELCGRRRRALDYDYSSSYSGKYVNRKVLLVCQDCNTTPVWVDDPDIF